MTRDRFAIRMSSWKENLDEEIGFQGITFPELCEGSGEFQVSTAFASPLGVGAVSINASYSAWKCFESSSIWLESCSRRASVNAAAILSRFESMTPAR